MFNVGLDGEDNAATSMLKKVEHLLKQSKCVSVLGHGLNRYPDKTSAVGRGFAERLSDHFIAELYLVFMSHMNQPGTAIIRVEGAAAALPLAPTHVRRQIIRQIRPAPANDGLIDTRRCTELRPNTPSLTVSIFKEIVSDCNVRISPRTVTR